MWPTCTTSNFCPSSCLYPHNNGDSRCLLSFWLSPLDCLLIPWSICCFSRSSFCVVSFANDSLAGPTSPFQKQKIPLPSLQANRQYPINRKQTGIILQLPEMNFCFRKEDKSKVFLRPESLRPVTASRCFHFFQRFFLLSSFFLSDGYVFCTYSIHIHIEET